MIQYIEICFLYDRGRGIRVKDKTISENSKPRDMSELSEEERALAFEEKRRRSLEARRNQRNRRVKLAVLLAFAAAGGIFFYETDRWMPQETTVVPVSEVIEGEKIEEAEPTAWDRIWEDPSRYPAIFLDALRRNPEIADFVEAYPGTPAEAAGGIRLMEKQRQVPLFIQWDSRWGYVPYGQSNVGISGCGPTCLSMVLFSITRDESLTPDALAVRAMEDGYYVEGEGTSWLFMRDICAEYGVQVSQFPYMEQQAMAEHLEAGKLVICAMGPGDFTDDGHFIVLTGYSDGRFSINDPFSRQNSGKTWDYDTLLPQIEQIWVYEKAAGIDAARPVG